MFESVTPRDQKILRSVRKASETIGRLETQARQLRARPEDTFVQQADWFEGRINGLKQARLVLDDFIADYLEDDVEARAIKAVTA